MLSARGGKNAKKRAVVAVAQAGGTAASVVASGEVYEPLRNSQKAMSTAA